MNFTEEQERVLEEARDNGLEKEIMAVMENPKLAPEQMHSLMITGLSSGYSLGTGDEGYDRAAAEKDFKERYARVQDAAGGFLSQDSAREWREYTPEEKEEYRADRRREVKELAARMEQGIRDVLESGQYKAYLDMMRKFHAYSFRNVMLIMRQNPEATMVAGFNAWKREHERFVRKGERGIRVFAPVTYKKTVEKNIVDQETGLFKRDRDGNPVMEKEERTLVGYKVTTVFDISQTDGKPLPEPVRAKALTEGYRGFDRMMDALRQTSPVPIRFGSVEEGTHGYYDLERKEIVVRAGMSEAQTVKTVIHEMSHALLHGRGRGSSQETKGGMDTETMEVQAESIAYITAGYYGLDTSEYSFPYAANWGGRDMKELSASLELIRDTSEKMIDGIGQALEKQRDMEKEAAPRQERAQERELCV